MNRQDGSLAAVVLVGGEGTRLRPLTDSLPKSMVPVLNKPFLEHTIAYLRNYGINNIILTLNYFPEAIQKYFAEGSRCEVELVYAIEDTPLGTAGAVKNAGHHLESTFIVLNGDVFTDLDINDLISFHRNKKAKITIALTRVDNPCAFGVVETDDEGKIRRFIEKPAPEEVTSHWINAGIYVIEPEVLEHVPTDTHYMFERGLFPLLLDMGEPLYGYHHGGYWLDMGTPEKYLCLNRDLLSAKTASFLPPDDGKGKTPDGETIIHPSARITGPVLIGDGCQIGEGVHIKGPTIIAARCRIGEGAVIEDAVLWAGADIGAGAVLKQCVIGADTRVKIGDRLINCAFTRDGAL